MILTADGIDRREAAGWAGSAVLLGYAATGIGLDIVLALVALGDYFTDAQNTLPLTPDWTGAAFRSAALLTGLAGVIVTLRYRRRRLGRCAVCARPGALPRWLSHTPAAAWLAAVLAVPYGLLKATWGLGSDFGTEGPEAFDGTTLWSPGFGDTVVLAAIALVLAVGYARTWTPRWIPRWMPLTAGTVGAAMLVPVGLIGTVQSIALLFTAAQPQVLDGISDWVFRWIYPLFLTWGVALGAAAMGYHYRTRGICRTCGQGG